MERQLSSQRHFCTYFDHRYLTRGLALHASLQAACPGSVLWVLALDDQAVQLLAQLDVPGLCVIPLEQIAAHDPQLMDSRANRSLVEFYFTCSPCLPRFLLDTQPELPSITYLDSDLFFFSSPEPVFTELGPDAVGIVPHRFAPGAACTHGRFGEYNVGWLTFANEPRGRACLEWWRQQCLEWCFDRLEGDRYADQKYLERFGNLFDGVHAIRHPGANLAPWNVDGHEIGHVDDRVLVDGQPLVFFHFQGLRRIGAHWYDSNLTGYGARLTPVLRDQVFKPYLQALASADHCVASVGLDLLPQPGPGVRRRAGLAGIRSSLGRIVRSAHAAAAGNLVRF